MPLLVYHTASLCPQQYDPWYQSNHIMAVTEPMDTMVTMRVYRLVCTDLDAHHHAVHNASCRVSHFLVSILLCIPYLQTQLHTLITHSNIPSFTLQSVCLLNTL